MIMIYQDSQWALMSKEIFVPPLEREMLSWQQDDIVFLKVRISLPSLSSWVRVSIFHMCVFRALLCI